MACVEVVNEGSTRLLNVVFQDEDGNSFTPVSLTIEVICLATGTIIQQAAAVPNPAPNMDIELTAEYNALVDRVANERELRRVILTAKDGGNNPYPDVYEYYVRRIRP